MWRVAPEFGFVDSFSSSRHPLSFFVRKTCISWGHLSCTPSPIPVFLVPYCPPSQLVIGRNLFLFGKPSLPLWGQWTSLFSIWSRFQACSDRNPIVQPIKFHSHHFHSPTESPSAPVHMAQEMISSGFHVNEEHGQMFTAIYENFYGLSSDWHVNKQQKNNLGCFLVILVFPIGNLLSTGISLSCPVSTCLLIIAIYTSLVNNPGATLERQSAPSRFIFIQIESSCCC